MVLTVRELPISPSSKPNPNPLFFEMIYNSPFDILARDIYEAIRIIDNDLCIVQKYSFNCIGLSKYFDISIFLWAVLLGP